MPRLEWLRRSPLGAGVLLASLGLAGRTSVASAQNGKVHVDIHGVSGPPADNVRATLQIAQEGKKAISPERVAQLARKADDDIRTALEPFGYYHAQITDALRRDGKNWVAQYDIDPGPVVHVTSVTIAITGEGDTSAAFRKFGDSFPLRKGDTLNQATYQVGKLTLVTLASDSGYLRAGYDTAAINIDRRADTSAILLRFHTGLRGTFGPVRFHESRDIIDTTLLDTRINFKRGDPFRHDKLLDFQTALANDPYWARVEVIPRPDEMQGHEVPIDVELVPNHRFSTEVGAGYGTDTGPRGHLMETIRWINRKGHNADLNLEIGQITQNIQGDYRIPAFGSPTGVLTFEAGYQRQHPVTAISHTGKIRTSLLRTELGWQETLALAFQHESYGVGLDSGTSVLLIPSASFTRTVSDSKTFPTHGYKAQVDLQAAHQSVLSNNSFAEFHVQAKGIWSWSKRGRILARGELGAMATRDFHALPPTLRFFAGGDESVRGFAYQALGEHDSAGNVIGGEALVVGSLETDYRVFSKYGVAAFTDVGNALGKISFNGLEQGVGAGLRWISPVGLVRVDGAFAVSRPGAPFRLHISIGADL